MPPFVWAHLRHWVLRKSAGKPEVMSQRTHIKTTVPNGRVEDARAILHSLTGREPGWTHRIDAQTTSVGTEVPGDQAADVEEILAGIDTDIEFVVQLTQ